MRKMAVILAFILLLAGCSGDKNKAAVVLENIPPGAVLVYTHRTGFEQGFVHSYGSWSAPASKGYFVIEFVLNKGGLTGVSIEEKDPKNNKKSVAKLGDIHGNIVCATQTIDTDNKTYMMDIVQIKDFDGIVNVYFVSS